MVRWTTLILFLAVVTVTTDSLRVFPESIRLFYRLYRAVARGGRILRDIAEGAGTVSEAIKSIDDLLDRTTDEPPVKEKLALTNSHDLPKKSTITKVATQTSKPAAKKKEPLKPPVDEKIVITKHVSDDITVKKTDVPSDSSPVAKKKVSKSGIPVDAAVKAKIEQAVPPSDKTEVPVEPQAETPPDEVDEIVPVQDDSIVASTDTKEKDPVPTPCKVSSSSTEDRSCSRPPPPEPTVTDLPSPAAVDPQLPSLNGCGALELHIKAPNLPVNKMTACCDAHDSCYIAACKANKRVCDNMLRGCLFAICEDKAIITAPGNLPNYCNAAAKLLYSGTMALSFHQYKEAQDQLKCRG